MKEEKEEELPQQKQKYKCIPIRVWDVQSIMKNAQIQQNANKSGLKRNSILRTVKNESQATMMSPITTSVISLEKP